MNVLRRVFRILFLCFASFSLGRFALLMMSPEEFTTLSLEQVLLAFIRGVRFDAAAFFPFMGVPLLLLSLPVAWAGKRWWQRLWAWCAFVCFVALLLVQIGCLMYFAQAGRHLADEVGQLQHDYGFILPFVLKGHLGLLLGVGAAVLVAARLWRRWVVDLSSNKPLLFAHFLPLVLLLFLGIRGSLSIKPIATVDAYAEGKRELGTLMLNGIFTASRALLTFNEVNRPQLSAEYQQRGLASLNIEPQAAYPFMRTIPAAATKKNVVLILLESWSHVYVDSFAQQGFKATPFFDSLAAKSRRYRNYFANGTRSIEAIQLIVSGVPPLKGLPTIDQGLDINLMPRLGSLAAERGYTSYFVQTSKRRSFRLDAVAHSLGFDYYFGWEDAPQILPYADPQAPQFGWDYESLMLLADKLHNTSKPFFAFLFTGTTHTPFALPPEPCRQHPHSSDSEGGFLNTLCYADWSLGEFFARIRTEPWFNDTIFILTADHTLGAYRHYSFVERHHIPLLVYDPSDEHGRDETKFASHMDLFPTIVSLLGGNAEVPTLGQSLFAPGEGAVMITGRYDNIGWISPQGFLVHSLERSIEQQFDPRCDAACQQGAEASLLTLEQLAFSSLRRNKWLARANHP